jgi:hypothetical protein
MLSTRLLAATFAAGVALSTATAAHAAAVADLTVTAYGGPTPVAAQRMPDGSATLALPHDGLHRDVYLDASASQGATWFAFDSDGDGWFDDLGYGGPSPRKLVNPAIRQERTSTVALNADPKTEATLHWRVGYQPDAHLTAPASAEEHHGATFDASDSVAWNSPTVKRPVARYQWDVEDGSGFALTTTSPTFVKSFPLFDQHACVRVRAVDVSGAVSEPAEACTTVTPALIHEQAPSVHVRPPIAITKTAHGPIVVPGPIEIAQP